MAVSKMAKVMIVSHRSEASELLEALQKEGICQILNTEQAMVTKDWPELVTAEPRPKEIEEQLGRLAKSITFLKNYGEAAKGLISALAPRVVIGEDSYKQVVSEKGILEIIDQCEQTETKIERLKVELENICAISRQLEPWEGLETPVEEIGQLKKTMCLAGLLPGQNFEKVEEETEGLCAAIQKIGATNNHYACLIVCLNENVNEIQKLLRSADFEQVNFHPMKGTAAELIRRHNEKLNQARKHLQEQHEKAVVLSKNLLKLEILHDHYNNLLKRECTKGTAPATEQTVILEGWVRGKDYARLDKTVSRFEASSLFRIAPAEGEEIPVEIENRNLVRPFEVITRLYGMPQYFEVDPTACLAPFFAIFFGVCLGDAGYGLALIALIFYLIKKMQGDKKLLWMLGICGGFTVIFGALTGGWFGNAVEEFAPALGPLKKKIMLFDPLEQPMALFGLSVALGYIQIMTGLIIGLVRNLMKKDYVAAVCDQLTWLIMLNSIILFGISKAGIIPTQAGKLFGAIALIPAGTILLLSQRQGGWGGRLGMGFYNLFSTIFYMGDVLSYLRLMGLSMVGAGLAMAINLIAKIALDIPYGIGIVVAILVFVGGHTFNLVLSALGAFVHTLRLQFVEYFPKFFVGGGRLFEPLSKEYKHIYIKKV